MKQEIVNLNESQVIEAIFDRYFIDEAYYFSDITFNIVDGKLSATILLTEERSDEALPA